MFAEPIKIIGRFFYRYFILNLYKFLYNIKKILKILLPTETFRPLYIFLNKYITHIVIIILVVSISVTNFAAEETRAEGFGEKSVLFALATGSNLEEQYIEETLEAGMPTDVNRYLGTETTAVTASNSIYTNEEAVDVNTELVLSDDNSDLIKPEFSSIEASKIKRDKTSEYIVQGGDTIGSIAQKFNISSNTVLWENNLSKFSLIKPGQKLSILPTSGISYKVTSGDNLNKIAKKYQADEDKIIEFNKLADASDITVGQIIFVPEGQPYYAPRPATRLASVGQIFNPVHVNVPSGTSMAWPTTARRISQYYNWRHTGLDIDGGFGDPIWAADDGVITKVAWLKYGYGYHIIIDHGGGKSTLYAHFQRINSNMKVGLRVARGDVLGEMGSTGYSTGSHLHFEVRFGSKKYNPLSYIK